ncbi:MAG: hypothetical protein UV58_C0011G0023 [Candidatus Wolfebacteria bacterium GW2011_GWC1_43_10]|uniref:DoxX family protein n=2 Tax=Candidatus Wolfeibacteriota TaxID=1752735 RepID=A0A0G1CA31_9BACT|nr:MAG: hypothetical protein UV58_C0011G0023 [Candidatus Wolfebacteria bacterium GW2011_GWC1_43_10]KKT22584.1 MAG: hypothetical protein UW08_C0006G0024 [Parcubacteria group bacterium GW2011_GWB1_43_8b]OGM89857.1 MAG: DoxX family protein [Candidatus Wolfebacteria bacterium GWA1_42_9]
MSTFEILFLLGRIIYGGYFIYSGINHLTKREGMASYASSKGVPAPNIAVFITGLLILLGGVGIVTGAYVVWAVIFLAAFLVPVSLIMHNFWKMSDPQMKAMERINFNKNMALLGAALMFLIISVPWPYSLF